MSEVESNLKEKAECGCSKKCGLYGTLRRPWSDGTQCVKGCPCPRCLGKRNRSKGDSKARIARKKLNIAGANTRHEELWGGAIRVEVKAGAQISPAVTAFLKCEAQSEFARAIGDSSPFMAIWMPDGMTDGICSFRLSKAADIGAALYVQLIDQGI